MCPEATGDSDLYNVWMTDPELDKLRRAAHDTVRFDLDADAGSIERAGDQQSDIESAGDEPADSVAGQTRGQSKERASYC